VPLYSINAWTKTEGGQIVSEDQKMEMRTVGTLVIRVAILSEGRCDGMQDNNLGDPGTGTGYCTHRHEASVMEQGTVVAPEMPPITKSQILSAIYRGAAWQRVPQLVLLVCALMFLQGCLHEHTALRPSARVAESAMAEAGAPVTTRIEGSEIHLTFHESGLSLPQVVDRAATAWWVAQKRLGDQVLLSWIHFRAPGHPPRRLDTEDAWYYVKNRIALDELVTKVEPGD